MADLPAPASLLALPRLVGLAAAADGRSYIVELDRPGAGRSSVVMDAGDRKSVHVPGWAVTALPDRCVLHLAEADTGPPRTVLWWRSLDRGEARPLAAPAGGVSAYVYAAAAGQVLYATLMCSDMSAEQDLELRRQRHALGTGAALYEPGETVHHGRGAGQRRIRLACLPFASQADAALLPEPCGARLRGGFAVADDALRVVAESSVDDHRQRRLGLHLAERGGTDRPWRWRRLAPHDDADFFSPVLSPGGRWLACTRVSGGSPGADSPGPPMSGTLWLFDLADPTDCGRPLATDVDVWPTPAAWAPDAGALYFTADRAGSTPVFSVEIATGAVRRLTGTGSFTDVQSRGDEIYAIRSAVDRVPVPTRLRPHGPSGRRAPQVLRSPTPDPAMPGHLERVVAHIGSAPVSGWLCRPANTGPRQRAPLLVWLHGGPRASWNAWSWRWCPWLAVARGYAVLMPDPAPSTGYGQAFTERAWGDWAGTPRADVMSLVDVVSARPDVDADRTAVMGGSFGGFLAYHLVARSSRFRAAVVHAGIWDLGEFVSSSTMARAFHGEFGHPLDAADTYRRQSPRSLADQMRTPLLISHGSLDPVVPFTQALTALNDLRRLGTPARLLQFPDEMHDITRPGNVRIWYEAVFAFLDHTLHDRPWRPPALLA
ncbi:dipeptidyl aminopeptidase/acylaminoacyl peptidase [Asanoa ferruginea]|uniref:Dipeptidyl aminopeptidase/acylaminoacyl peptidase n=1 Tax=Asanoa ferruginea TaxID=53367 RepID=A0A3D9ZS47_9ACTN|nr:dipeptidyl aminopeptidase/acylaminoacyl peptidase [Asanoa ferruginea]GIF50419.1 peptidase S9 [Asanoa ferruginea]